MRSKRLNAGNTRRGLTLGEFRVFTEHLSDDFNIKFQNCQENNHSINSKKTIFIIEKINKTIYLKTIENCKN